MYTLADAVRLKDHVLERWEAADRDPAWPRTAPSTSSSSAAARPASRRSARSRSSTAPIFARDYRNLAARRGTADRRRGRRRAFPMFKPKLRDYTAKALADAHRRGDDRRAGRFRLADARDAQVRDGAQRAHARLGRGAAGQPARSSLPLELAGETESPSGPTSAARPPGGVRRRRRGRDHRLQDGAILPQLGSVALQSGEHAGETIARRIAGKKTKTSPTATRGRWRRSDAGPPSSRCSPGER